MKKHICILLILPIILAITASLLRYASGPYWIHENSDPTYVYLIKFLAEAENKETLTSGHPGTTLQMFGATVIKITHALNFSEKDSLAFAVLKNPEFYLTVTSFVLLFLNTILLFILGLFTFKVTNNLWLSLLIQFSPFFSNVILTLGVASVTPEALLLFSSLLFVLILVRMVLDQNISASAYGYMIAFALVCSFGLATKLTFGPLLLIPFFVLPGWRNKAGFLFLTGACFILWITPIIPQYKILGEWYSRLITHSGYYGHGDQGIINFSIYASNLKSLSLGNPLFCFILLCAVTFIIKFRPSLKDTKPYRILVVVVIAQLSAIVIMSKHGYDYYFLPVLNLSGFTLFLIFLCLKQKGFFSHENIKKTVIFASLFFVFCGAWRIIDLRTIFTHRMELKQESLMINLKLITQYQDYFEIIPLRASSPLGALAFGNYFLNEGLYSKTLQEIYGEKYFFSGLEGKFHTWTQEFFIEDLISSGKVSDIVAIVPDSQEYINVPCKTGSLLRGQNVFRGKHASIYVLRNIFVGVGNFQRQSLSPERR